MTTSNNFPFRVVFTDIDGVWTDGGMFYNDRGEAFKKFNTTDSAGILFLKKLAVPLVVLTGEDSEPVKRRMEKLGVELLFSGVKDKWKQAHAYCQEHHISLSDETAFIGNDLNDRRLLKAAAYSAVPCDAPDYIQKEANTVLPQKGGEGVFREFIEHLIGLTGDFDRFIRDFS